MATTRSHRPPATPVTRNHGPVPALTIASTGERPRTTRGQPVCSRGDVLMTSPARKPYRCQRFAWKGDLSRSTLETLRAENTQERMF